MEQCSFCYTFCKLAAPEPKPTCLSLTHAKGVPEPGSTQLHMQKCQPQPPFCVPKTDCQNQQFVSHFIVAAFYKILADSNVPGFGKFLFHPNWLPRGKFHPVQRDSTRPQGLKWDLPGAQALDSSAQEQISSCERDQAPSTATKIKRVAGAQHTLGSGPL